MYIIQSMFIMESDRVLCEVGTKHLYIIETNVSHPNFHFTHAVCLRFLQFFQWTVIISSWKQINLSS